MRALRLVQCQSVGAATRHTTPPFNNPCGMPVRGHEETHSLHLSPRRAPQTVRARGYLSTVNVVTYTSDTVEPNGSVGLR